MLDFDALIVWFGCLIVATVGVVWFVALQFSILRTSGCGWVAIYAGFICGWIVFTMLICGWW